MSPWVLGVSVSAVLLAILLALVGSQMRSCQASATEVADATHDSARAVEAAGHVLSGILGGQVTINNHGVVKVPREIAQLAILEHDVEVVSRFTREGVFGWFPATLEITGHYRGLLGIDVEKVSGHFDPDTLTLELTLPASKVVAVETRAVEHTRQDDWWVNRLGTGEAVQLAARNREAARGQLHRKDLRRMADRQLRYRLQEAFASTPVTLRLGNAGAAGKPEE